MEIRNGATVHRIWKTLPDAELVAVFQYTADAARFCRAAIDDLQEGTFLVSVCHHTGEMKCFHKAEQAEG